MYKIGELSKLCNLPVKTLRYYDNEGLLPPDYIDKFTGYRYYSAAKLSDCYRIITLKELGFSLTEIKELFSLPKDKFSDFLKNKEQELQELKSQTEHRINILQNLNTALKENVTMFDIVIRNSDEIRLAYHREIIPVKTACISILDQIRNTVPDRILGSRMVLIDYETEYRNGLFDTGFGMEITGELPPDCGYTEKTIHFSTDTASLICSETEYEQASQALHRHVLDNDYQIVGPTYKIMYPDSTVELKLPVVRLTPSHPVCNEELIDTFENDESAIGHWELVDLLPCREMFHPGKQKTVITEENIKELYFLPQGERYWCFSWTKGYLLSTMGYPHSKRRNKYTIETIEGQTYLFVEFKGKDFCLGGQPELWVFRKTDSKKYRKEDIGNKDEIPELPANDTSVLGHWDVCALVRDIEAFQPQENCSLIPYEGLFWRSAEFLPEGTIRNSFKNSETGRITTDEPHLWRWVNGHVILNTRPCVSKYVIKEINDTEYLFVQWKSGDYVYGKRKPDWYVFRRNK